MTRALTPSSLDRPAVVFVLYLALTLVMTWPLVFGLTRDLPSDLGDPAFVSALLTWGSDHYLRLLGGDLRAVTHFWDAPWFYPEPLATAFSEHFLLHSLLTLPVYVASGNVILCYNLLFLATFTLSGFGMYLFVRELTGRPLAAFVAGIAFAFAPYRFGSMEHLQVLSSQWMPFVLYGFRRYFATRRTRPLVGASLALLAQHLSSGYYMVFFGPFVALYVLAEIMVGRLWRDIRVWLQILAAGGAAILLTLPFAVPYLIVRNKYNSAKELQNLSLYAADLLGWVTASPRLTIWGGMQTFVKAEGYLFPGITILLLAIVGLIVGWRAVVSKEAASKEATSKEPVSKEPASQGAKVAAVFGTAAVVLSCWLSLGPQVQLATQPTSIPAIYQIPYAFIPGFDVARVPARFAMITILGLATLAGLALARLEIRRRSLVVICGALILAEGAAFPLQVNRTWTTYAGELLPPETRIYPATDMPPVYRYLRSLDNAVVAHLPFGAPEREIQYDYYAAMHGRRTVNGYSGAFPPTWLMRLGEMRNAATNPKAAQSRMFRDGVTHLVIHAGAWTGDTGKQLVAEFDHANGFERVGPVRRRLRLPAAGPKAGRAGREISQITERSKSLESA